MTAIQRYTGLNVNITIDAADLARKYVSQKLDPATDIDLAADVIQNALSLRAGNAVSTAVKLYEHLQSEYSVTFSGNIMGVPWKYDFGK